MRYAVIENNSVTNIIEAERADALPDLTLMAALDFTAIGDVLVNGALPDKTPPAPNSAEVLAATKESALAQIDAVAEAERGKYITSGSGQAMVYQRKQAEAMAFLSNAEGPFPHLEAEVGITAPTVRDVAETVLAMETQWVQISAMIEATRLSAKAMVRECTTAEAVQPIIANLTWPNA